MRHSPALCRPTLGALLIVVVLACASANAAAQLRGPRALDAARPIGTFVATGAVDDGYRPADRQLAEWALAAWQRATGGRLTLTPATEDHARVRLYWAGPQGGQYGEMRSLLVDGAVGAAVYIRPDTRSLGSDIDALATADPLFRDTVVYLTCLHELGHALGLEHTAAYADIMYSFQHGGDLVEYFARFRRQLKARGDIAHVSGMSDADVAALRRLYPAR
jgi:hypothetical protein